MSDVTQSLNAIERKETGATERLLPLVYEELRHLATQRMSQEPSGQTLQATALVHEAYIRLIDAKDQNWNSSGHFFKAAAEAMRRILVENARRKRSLKRGGGKQRVEFDESMHLTVEEFCPDDLLALDKALDKLLDEDPVLADLIKLHYFAGLTLEEVAVIQGISRRTAVKHLAFARAWLHREMAKGDELAAQ
jgi:RNA polymerase sigma factor (TIGR02999 family)